MRPKHKSTVIALICFVALLVSSYLGPISVFTRFSRSLSFHFVPTTNIRLPFETISISEASATHPQRRELQRNLSAFLDIIVTQYTNWHRQQRLRCQANATHAHSLPLLVLRINNDHGIGDRIRAILYNYLAAVASNRLYLLDIQQPLPLTNVFRSPPSHNFTYDAALFTASSDEEHVFVGPAHFRNLSMHLSSIRVLVDEFPNTFGFKAFFRLYNKYPDLPLTRAIIDAGLKDFRVPREVVAPFILRALFESTASLRSSLERLVPFDGQPYISVHARLGHGVGEDWGRFNFSEQGHTLRGLSHCIGWLGATMAQQHGHERVFVITDTQHVREFIEDGIRSAAPGTEIAHSPIRATHFRAMFGNVTIPDERVRRHRFEEVFVDLGLLSMAKSMVFFFSGFPMAAAWLGGIKDSVLVEYDDCTQLRGGKLNATELFSKRLLSVGRY
eukprot:TRINITY_DN1938_c0_g2_i1.p1 TRINITY_DN1938_c0_g2~~TRINITY_DN1938_c0_g2_i1.p1  ORF type:complete len:445 (+),score=54.51 TRINITY_DN1938_c0_g2_i1:686-2020(+)